MQNFVGDTPASSAQASRAESRLVAALLAACCGLGIVWAVGFSDIEVLHNAAHDTRHSNVFPCH